MARRARGGARARRSARARATAPAAEAQRRRRRGRRAPAARAAPRPAPATTASGGQRAARTSDRRGRARRQGRGRAAAPSTARVDVGAGDHHRHRPPVAAAHAARAQRGHAHRARAFGHHLVVRDAGRRSRPRSRPRGTVHHLVDEVAVREDDLADAAGQPVGQRRAAPRTRGAAGPARSDSRSAGEASGCTATMRTSGRCAFTAAAMPAMSPPPPTGTTIVPDVGHLLQDLERRPCPGRPRCAGRRRRGRRWRPCARACSTARGVRVVVGGAALAHGRPGRCAACPPSRAARCAGTKSVAAHVAAQRLRGEGHAEGVVARRRRPPRPRARSLGGERGQDAAARRAP